MEPARRESPPTVPWIIQSFQSHAAAQAASGRAGPLRYHDPGPTGNNMGLGTAPAGAGRGHKRASAPRAARANASMHVTRRK